MHDDTLYWIWLSELAGFSLRKKRKLLASLGGPEQIFRASATTVDEVLHGTGSCSSAAEGVAKEISLASSWKGRNLAIAQAILSNNEKAAIKVLDPTSPYYRHIYEADEKAPLVLYYRGRLADPSIPVVGVVGSRSCTSYGRLVTKVQYRIWWVRAALLPRASPSASTPLLMRPPLPVVALRMPFFPAACTRHNQPHIPI
jgi:DNA processing protein